MQYNCPELEFTLANFLASWSTLPLSPSSAPPPAASAALKCSSISLILILNLRELPSAILKMALSVASLVSPLRALERAVHRNSAILCAAKSDEYVARASSS